jgi:hypothetical protein
MRKSVVEQRVTFQENLHTLHTIWEDQTSFAYYGKIGKTTKKKVYNPHSAVCMCNFCKIACRENYQRITKVELLYNSMIYKMAFYLSSQNTAECAVQ